MKQVLRQCILTRDTLEKKDMIRLVVGMDGKIYVDLAEKLPGRGFWISPNRKKLTSMIKKGKFIRAIRQKRSLETDKSPQDMDIKQPLQKIDLTLIEDIENLLKKRILNWLGLLNRAGDILSGFHKIEAAIKKDTINKDNTNLAPQPMKDQNSDGKAIEHQNKTQSKIQNRTTHKKARSIAFFLGANDSKSDGQKKMAHFEKYIAPVYSCFDRTSLSQALGVENCVHIAVFQGNGARSLEQELLKFQKFCHIS